MSVNVKTKVWGNSIGVVIPREIAKSLKIDPGEEIVIEVMKKENVLKELFGSLSFKKTREELVKNVRKDHGGIWVK